MRGFEAEDRRERLLVALQGGGGGVGGLGVVAAMHATLSDAWLYPDGSGFVLKRKLAAKLGVTPEQVTLGNGSNDVLVLLAEAFLTPDTDAVYSQYAFAVYPIAVQATGATARVAA